MNSVQLGNIKSSNSSELPNMKKFLRKFWPLFFVRAVVALSVAGLMLNMLGISKIIWPYDPFHSVELGLIVGLKTISLAIMGLVFGFFADRFSRKYLLIFVLMIMGIGRFFNGFVPLNEFNTYLLFLLSYIVLGIGQGGVLPIIFSISNDTISFKARSRFFGVIVFFFQLFVIFGMLLSSVLIQAGLWRIYYWSTGILLFIGSFIMLFFKEPKRGLMYEELAYILSTQYEKDGIKFDTKYDYKLTKETIRSTIFSPTNIIAFIEGISTWILFSIAIYMIYPYIQSPPKNVSPVVSSLLMIIFGLPGAIFGSIAFSKLSDRLAAKDIKNRIYMIVFSMGSLFFLILIIFIMPLPTLLPWEGNYIENILKYPVFFLFGGLLFILRAIIVIYAINQNPVLQKINLPEAQATISSWNQFLEFIG
ncbi:MAG: MFS transporter, partial [Candidatus Hodarchaeota archaeon]